MASSCVGSVPSIGRHRGRRSVSARRATTREDLRSRQGLPPYRATWGRRCLGLRGHHRRERKGGLVTTTSCVQVRERRRIRRISAHCEGRERPRRHGSTGQGEAGWLFDCPHLRAGCPVATASPPRRRRHRSTTRASPRLPTTDMALSIARPARTSVSGARRTRRAGRQGRRGKHATETLKGNAQSLSPTVSVVSRPGPRPPAAAPTGTRHRTPTEQLHASYRPSRCHFRQRSRAHARASVTTRFLC